MSYIVCHYHEVALKGKNRSFFEEKLQNAIRAALKGEWLLDVKRLPGRIVVQLTDEATEKHEEITIAMQRVFGIAYFAFAEKTDADMDTIRGIALQQLKKEQFQTFRVTTKRGDKDFELTSQQINEHVGEYIIERLDVQVDLEHPEVALYIEITHKGAFIYTQRLLGPGGLPAGTGGKAVVMLSGGIDSPVAAFYVARRGVQVTLVHFHAYPYTQKASIEKAEKIREALALYQPDIRLVLVSFGEIQKDIVTKTPPELRMVLYRRMMGRISEAIAQKEGASALVTGESIGQVASQTLENIQTIWQAVDMPVLQPVIGFDKEDIIKKAHEIGTYDISTLPHEDCCSRFLPTHPATRARLQDVLEAEKNLDIEKLVKEAVEGADLNSVKPR